MGLPMPALAGHHGTPASLRLMGTLACTAGKGPGFRMIGLSGGFDAASASKLVWRANLKLLVDWKHHRCSIARGSVGHLKHRPRPSRLAVHKVRSTGRPPRRQPVPASARAASCRLMPAALPRCTVFEEQEIQPPCRSPYPSVARCNNGNSTVIVASPPGPATTMLSG
jgi:hypothetical protein